jgi:hypothetical protein
MQAELSERHKMPPTQLFTEEMEKILRCAAEIGLC